MKKISLTLCTLLTVLSIQSASAGCNWASITKSGSEYLYSKECHVEVGESVKKGILKTEQIGKLKQSIEFKDIALSKSTERVELWKKTSFKMEDRLIKHDKYAKNSGWVMFGGGILTTLLTAWAVGQVTK